MAGYPRRSWQGASVAQSAVENRHLRVSANHRLNFLFDRCVYLQARTNALFVLYSKSVADVAAVSDDVSYISVVPPEANSNSDEHTDPDCTIPTSNPMRSVFTEISHEKVSNVWRLEAFPLLSILRYFSSLHTIDVWDISEDEGLARVLVVVPSNLLNVVMQARDSRWSWLGHVLRMPEHRLVRQVQFNCVKTYSRDAFRRRTKPKYRERY